MPFKHNKSFYIAAGLIVGWAILLMVYYGVFADTWFDEGAYAYQSWLTAEGLASPFADFRTKYGPVGFYAQTGIQWLIGPDLLATRFFFAAFFAGMLVLMFDLLRRHGGKWLGLIAISLLVFHPYLVGKFTSVNAYSLVGLFSILTLWFLFNERFSARQKVLFASLAAGLAFLTRYNLLPLIPLLWIFVYWQWRNWRLFLLSVISVIAIVAAGLVPYLLIDAEFALSFILAMFGPAASWLPLPYLDLFVEGGAGSSSFADALKLIVSEDQLKLIMNIFTSYYHLLALGLGGFAYLLYASRKRLGEFLRSNGLMIFSLILSILLFLAHYLTPQGGTKIYSLYFIPLFAVFGATVLYAIFLRAKEQNAWSTIKGPATTLLVAIILLTPLSLGIFGYDIVFFTRLDHTDTDLARVKRGADYLKKLTSARDVILTIDNPHIFYEAERYIIPPLINVGFTYINSPESALLERYKFYNSEMFLNWLKNTADAVVFQRDGLAEAITPMGITQEKRKEFDALLKEKYQLAGSIPNVYFRKVQRGEGIMEVYKRKK